MIFAKNHHSSYQHGGILRRLGTLSAKRGRIDIAEFHRKAQWVRVGPEEAEAASKQAKALMDTVHKARVLSQL
jgi:hypothetical protein